MVEVGFLLPSRDAIVAEDDDPRRLVALAERAEGLGFDSVWAGDSPVARPRVDAVTLLAAVAARTRRVRLGTAVLLPALRHPVLLAHQLASLDALAGGRLIVGVGSGFAYPPTARQFAALGVPYDRRLARLEEAVDAMRALWSGGGDPASYAGEHFRFDDVAVRSRAPSPGGPPIWMAGLGTRAEARVGRLADGWLPYPPRPETYAAGLRRITEAAEAAKRPRPTAALYATVALEREGVPAQRRLRESVERYYDAPLEALAGIQALFAGEPEAVADAIGAYIDVGVEHVVLRVADDDPEAALEVLAETVLPRLRTVRRCVA